MRTVLIAGVGNVLKGDDGFGVEAARRLALRPELPISKARVMESGIGGMSLIQELMQGYDALLLLDAYRNGGAPGQLYMLEPVIPDLSQLNAQEMRDYFADTHYATPMRVLTFLAHTGHLPRTVRILGCEPEEFERMRIGLSPAVEAAVNTAIEMALNWITEYRAGDSIPRL
jgi:hydrogenase maturation protease